MNTHRPLVLLSKQLVDEDEKEYVIVTHTLPPFDCFLFHYSTQRAELFTESVTQAFS